MKARKFVMIYSDIQEKKAEDLFEMLGKVGNPMGVSFDPPLT